MASSTSSRKTRKSRQSDGSVSSLQSSLSERARALMNIEVEKKKVELEMLIQQEEEEERKKQYHQELEHRKKRNELRRNMLDLQTRQEYMQAKSEPSMSRVQSLANLVENTSILSSPDVKYTDKPQVTDIPNTNESNTWVIVDAYTRNSALTSTEAHTNAALTSIQEAPSLTVSSACSVPVTLSEPSPILKYSSCSTKLNTSTACVWSSTPVVGLMSSPGMMNSYQPGLNPTALPYVGQTAPNTTSNLGMPSHVGSRAIVADELSRAVMALENTVLTQQEHNRCALLPDLKLERFNGDITLFKSFKNSYEWNVVNNTDDMARRLSLLYSVLEGPPKKLVAGCMHLPANEGYVTAWKLLNERYDNSYELTESHIRTLMNWKSIKEGDVAALEDYAAYLFSVQCALGADITRLEMRDNMSRIASKLPCRLQHKWASISFKYYNQPVPFQDMVKFVNNHASIARQMKYIEEVNGKGSNTPFKGPRENPKMINSIQVKQDEPCPFCQKPGHAAHRCYKFNRKSVGDRWNAVIAMKLCFNCLKGKHVHSKCTNKAKCDECGAESHHTVLHRPIFSQDDKSDNKKRDEEINKAAVDNKGANGGGMPADGDRGGESTGARPKESAKKLLMSMSSISLDGKGPNGRVMMKILPIKVNKDTYTYAFLDSGAAATLVARSLVDKLGVKGTPTRQLFSTECGEFRCNEIVSLHIGGCNKEDDLLINEVFITGSLNLSLDHLIPVSWTSNWSHLNDVELIRLPDEYQKIELIIGLNSSLCRTILDQRHGEENEPSAHLTRFGWAVFGPTGKGQDSAVLPVNHLSMVYKSDITQSLQQHFNRDFWESEAHSRIENSVEDERFLAKVSSSITKDSGKYVISLPYRDDSPLPNNKELAVQRLKSLQRKFSKNEEYKKAYVSSIEKYISKGYAEYVPTDNLNRKDGRVNYMPHFSVIHPVKKKLRVVFDNKITYQGTSLNDHLLQGPDLTNTLLGVVLRFRDGLFAVTADIEEMFHQVKVPVEDRDALRFLWQIGGDLSIEPDEFRMRVHVFGARSSPSCVNFALRHAADEFGHKYDAEVALSVKRNFYVDNLLKASSNKETCIKLVKELIALCEEGGFHLNQWTSNSKEILAAIPESEHDVSVASLDLAKDELPMERTLGVHWSMETDEFTFKIDVKNTPISRRQALSVTASFYDPMGIGAPVTLPVKMWLQDMCQQGLAWDDKLHEGEMLKWKRWLEELPKLSQFRLARSFVPMSFGPVQSYQLHHFADASQKGYGTATYLRTIGESGEVFCILVIGRARVAPLKKTTVPRLELTAAAVAARMDAKLRLELNLKLLPSIFWTDSTSVLKYLFNETARYHTFVANRVHLIRDLTPVTSWRYVDTHQNPADLASRGMTIDEFLKSKMWVSGPQFLWEEEKTWPSTPEDVKFAKIYEDPEVKSASLPCQAVAQEDSFWEDLVSHFSSWTKFVRCVAWIKRFIVIKLKLKRTDFTKWLSSSEIQDAELTIWKAVQLDSFEEARCVKDDEPLHIKSSSKISKLKPFMKNGLLRVGGRLAHSFLSYDAKHPIILPNSSPIVKLMIRRKHEELAHCGQNYLLAELRDRFWILKGSRTVKQVLHECVSCRKIQARPMVQEMANLPEDRITPGEPPFTHVGTDCFGPFLTKIARSERKRYGLIFTCLVTRAIHLEVINSMDTDAFINGLRRFVARRGQVKSIRSDNGTNFVGAEKELRAEMEKLKADNIANVMSTKGINWTFNPPHASHFGGVWERQIRTVRRVLVGLCHQQVLTDDTLHTLFCEVEALVNGRPLTRLTDDSDSLQALTPSHLLTLKGAVGPHTQTDRKDMYVKRRWRQVQYLADLFWSRWTREYLPQLQERQKWHTRQKNLQVGDVVLTLDEKLSRGIWPLGRVMEVMKSDDGLVRSVRVRTENGEYLRPIAKLCLLLENEIQSE